MSNVIPFPVKRKPTADIKPGDIVTFKNGDNTITGPLLEIRNDKYLVGDINVWHVPKDLVKKAQ